MVQCWLLWRDLSLPSSRVVFQWLASAVSIRQTPGVLSDHPPPLPPTPEGSFVTSSTVRGTYCGPSKGQLYQTEEPCADSGFKLDAWNFAPSCWLWLYPGRELSVSSLWPGHNRLSPRINISPSLHTLKLICNFCIAMKTRKLSRVERMWKVSFWFDSFHGHLLCSAFLSPKLLLFFFFYVRPSLF